VLLKAAKFLLSLSSDYCQRFGTQEGARSQHIKWSSAAYGL